MMEDQLLVWKIKHGSSDALGRIYEKYKNNLLALALSLLPDRATAEDVVHDVFVSFAELAQRLQLRGSLKSYLLSSVANRARNLSRAKSYQTLKLNEEKIEGTGSDSPDRKDISTEESQRISNAMAQLPYPQREVILLHLLVGMKFRMIAKTQGVSINTIQSRYRYGLDKLRSSLKNEVTE
jgi:RNA polymerase sigma-70 factor (ECF subfamily)